MLWPDIAAVDECRSPSLVPQDSVSHSFSLGSTVQLLSDPIRYGVIQWIGTLPGIEGYIAGVELVRSSLFCSYYSYKCLL